MPGAFVFCRKLPFLHILFIEYCGFPVLNLYSFCIKSSFPYHKKTGKSVWTCLFMSQFFGGILFTPYINTTFFIA